MMSASFICSINITVMLVFQLSLKEAAAGDHEKRLYRRLLQDYDNLVRPVADESEPVRVVLGMDLQQLIDIDEKNQLIETNAWLKFEWHDIYLQWDPEDYGNVDEVRLPISLIWKPDVLLYNSGDKEFDTLYRSNAIVYSSGNISWIPPGIILSTCKIDITFFPFDDQKCSLKWGSWTYSGKQIDLQAGKVETATFIENGEWILMDVPVVRNVQQYDCCPDPYLDVTFTIWVRRRTLYYTMNLIIPCILISSMTLLGFLLPSDTGEKLTLVVTIFMSLCVTMLMIADAMPQTSDTIPLISLYFSSIMVVVSLSILFTVIALNYNHRSSETHSFGPFVKTVLLRFLPWLLLMRRPSKTSKTFPSSRSANIALYKKEKYSHSLLSNLLDFHEEVFPDYNLNDTKYLDAKQAKVHQKPQPSVSFSVNSNDLRLTSTTPLETPKEESPQLAAICRELRYITSRMQKIDTEEDVKMEWRFAAMVIDRFCLVVSALILLGSTALFLTSAPHLIV